jgi:predicted DCC family thiol-disulfide oxidoreductase YuxK
MIVVFDAQCLLCSGWVRFLLRHDRHGRVQFAPSQGAAGARWLAEAGLQTDDLLVLDGGRRWRDTAALMRVFHELGWPWRLVWVAWLVPAPLRGGPYRWIARNRHRLFGRTDTCLMPAPEHAGRFLN